MSNATHFQNIDLALRTKERFTINGNEDKFIELNTGDVGISTRFADAIPKINEWVEKVENLAFTDENDEISDTFSAGFKEADLAIRELVNNIFDYDVCSVCVSDGSMFDLTDGNFAFEIIIETLFGLYEKTINDEAKRLQKRIKSHTDKYLPQDRKRKS